ncbi:hypothetical protein [uncultured Jatrophihabitans sp.]|uniref:hypothetical protein n=1 Tax=uncultured Jatrophihabitans sp. TaxID=1610747 RepID=UPI0035C94392
MSWIAEDDGGVCWDCGGPIMPGQSVDRSNEPEVAPWMHIECPVPVAASNEAA